MLYGNAYHMTTAGHKVFMLDPLSTSGVEMLEYVKLFLDHLVPARLGLVLLPDPENEVAVAVCQGFAFLSMKYSPREGLRWLLKVCAGKCMSLCFMVYSLCAGPAIVNDP